MDVKLFGDTTPINWELLGVKMPFAPMHQLATKYPLTTPAQKYYPNIDSEFPVIDLGDILRTFELTQVDTWEALRLRQRIVYRTANTVAALDTCSPDSVSINVGGGMHHAGKKASSGYAYSLVNDIIWAVDYQLEQRTPNYTIGIIDLDFHFGGGTAEYYEDNLQVHLNDYYHPKGVLMKHTQLIKQFHQDWIMSSSLHDISIPDNCDTILLNIGTDWYHLDPLFGKYGDMVSADILDVWWKTIKQITERKIPLCITMGGGYGSCGLQLYAELISWIKDFLK